MPAVGRVLLGAFAVFILLTLVRALRSGVIYSDGVACDAHARPGTFASLAAIHGGGAVLFAWLAANGGIARVLSLIGQH
jgi:hypothetical protein